MKVEFSDHARKQIKERGLSQIFVASSIRKPTSIRRQKDGRFQFIKLFKQEQKRYSLIIITEKNIDTLTIVTVFKTSKIKKFL